jgi:hypothetical protein
MTYEALQVIDAPGSEARAFVFEPAARSSPGVQPVGPKFVPRRGSADPPTTGIPTTLDELPVALTRSFDLSVTAALSLNIPVIGSISGGFSRRVVVSERVAYKALASTDGSVYHFGYALRLCVTVSRLDSSMKLSLPFIAASAEVGNVAAAWMLQVLGLTGPRIDAVTLPPRELNVETFVLAKQSLEALMAGVRDPTTRLSAQIVAVDTTEDARDRALQLAASETYALSRIERRSTLADAIARLDADDLMMLDAVVDVYTIFVGPDPTMKPSEAAAAKASALLGRVDAGPR